MDASPAGPIDAPGEPEWLPVPLADLPAWWGPVLDASAEDRKQHGGEVDLLALAEYIGTSPPEALREFASANRPTRAYLVVEKLSTSTWAGVYIAVDMATKRPIVLKISRRRVEHEGGLIASLNHPNVVTVHGMFVHAGHPTTVLEWCEQGTLHRYARNFGWRDTLARVLEAGRGLAHLHAQGLVHADLKPTNILIHHGTGKLGDLGLARPETTQGPLWGTPGYAAPERERGEYSFAGDVYSFALTIEHLILKHRDVPRSIRRLLDAATAEQPERRPALADLLANLERERQQAAWDHARHDLAWRQQHSWLQTLVMFAFLAMAGGTAAVAAVCSEPIKVGHRIDLAAEAASRGDSDLAIQHLELAVSASHDRVTRHQVADAAERLGHEFLAAGDRTGASRSWWIAFECFEKNGDTESRARVANLFTNFAVP